MELVGRLGQSSAAFEVGPGSSAVEIQLDTTQVDSQSSAPVEDCCQSHGDAGVQSKSLPDKPSPPTLRQVVSHIFLLFEKPEDPKKRGLSRRRKRMSRFEKDSARLVSMMGPVSVVIVLTVLYVKLLRLSPRGSQPFQPLLPRP